MATSTKRNGREAFPKLSFEATLWAAADKLRGNMDAAEYKHVVLGLIFLKYISDAFEERHAQALRENRRNGRRLAEDRDEYRAENVFWVPKTLAGSSSRPTPPAPADHRQAHRRRDGRASRTTTRRLKGVLTKNYARPALDKIRLGELIDLFADLAFRDENHGAGHARPRLRVLPRAVRQRRGQERRRVLHAAFASCALLVEMLAAVQGPRLRPVLRLRRHVRPVARSSSRRTAASATTSRSSARSRTTRPGGWPR